MKNYNISSNSFILQDKEERAKALDYTKSIHCESPAGSGKTTLLTERFLLHLSKTGHPHNLLALTFTNKAAGEMRQRIWDALRDAEKGNGGSNERQIAARKAFERHKDKIHLLYSPDGLRIMTFHSLCHAIARSTPLEAGVPPDISIIDGVEYDELLYNTTDKALNGIAALKNGDQKKTALERWLLRTNNNWTRLRSDCINLIKRRDYLKDLISLLNIHKDIELFQKKANQALGLLIGNVLEKTQSEILLTDLGRNWREFSKYLNNTEDNSFLESFPKAEWDELPKWQWLANFLITKEGTPRKRFPRDIFPKTCQSQKGLVEMISALPCEVCQILNELKTLPVDGYDKEQIQSIFDIILILSELISEWQFVCLRQGVIDFVGLELACLKALSHIKIPDIHFIMGSKITHLLVDEFQDTSRNQWEILQRLCSGWTIGDGRTLFLVGDPKQSIYAFRKAEVSLFVEAKKGLPIPGQGKLPLESVILKNNFRSTPGLVEWTNKIFGQTVMSYPRTDVDEVPFSPSTVSIEGKHTLSLALFIQNEKVPDTQIAEANWLARSVAELNSEIKENERISILLFTRTRIHLYLQALNETGIDVKVTEGLMLAECIEVLIMHQLARALVRPQDDLAWASVIRAPWCWSSTDLLCGIWQEKNPAWIDKIEAFVKSGKGESIKKWWEILKGALMKVGREPISKIIKNAWLEIEGAYKLACLLGSDSVANILSYLEILEECEQFIPEETLEKVEMEIQKAYVPSSPRASRSRIELMTVHKAKGLEFDYVFCPYMDWDPLGGERKDRPPYLLENIADGQSALALRKDQRQEKEDLIYGFLLNREHKRKLAEAKRLFYVAVTRAKKGLYLSGTGEIKNERISARCKDSPLSYIIKHEGISRWDIDCINNEGYTRTGTEGISIQINPTIFSDIHPYIIRAVSMPPLPKPFPFSPEKLPYKVISPSEQKEGGSIDDSLKDQLLYQNLYGKERVRGIVIHQIFAWISRGHSLPSEKAVAYAIYREGLDLKEAANMAKSILEEVNLCKKEPMCAWIIGTDHPEAYSEWSIEDTPDRENIRSGIIDRLIYDSKKWWIIDYKTVQKQTKGPSDFFDQQARLYRPQMESYREMISHWKGVSKDKISMLLYFTAFQKAYHYPA